MKRCGVEIDAIDMGVVVYFESRSVRGVIDVVNTVIFQKITINGDVR
jgi:hypothetical protein